MDAFVLGGGGQLGASEVGMLRALLERGVTPDLVVGTSVGAINGAAVASEPTIAMVQRLQQTWSDIERSDVFGGSFLNRLATAAPLIAPTLVPTTRSGVTPRSSSARNIPTSPAPS